MLKWNSVNDTLPLEHKYVLVDINGRAMGIYCIQYNKFTIISNDSDNGKTGTEPSWYPGGLPVCNSTAWTFLPERDTTIPIYPSAIDRWKEYNMETK